MVPRNNAQLTRMSGDDRNKGPYCLNTAKKFGGGVGVGDLVEDDQSEGLVVAAGTKTEVFGRKEPNITGLDCPKKGIGGKGEEGEDY